ncbi:transmembrane protein, putative (macronuclear) [Tetrahymena thermophila SB210]|uniref:Transmembrane protein, putative n=1 Tax=Tetrahymena thermophila (strain SB210) TaxID=312017 RepID=W7XDZ7_TETTS|nr:transmembrane protein, putative [Tetrahymena thermophila SB210]EWS71069.1 transmembrane protein, putative [Tetrahymena thermophila SB210]|eukprot:XP_012656368.1 transmembrane protein, putative [Tetrahymena thermophila SB210]
MNQIDIYSTKVCGLSILLCVFISNNEYYYFQVSCFIIIIIINLLFILNIGIKILKHQQNQFVQFLKDFVTKYPQIQRFLRLNIKKKQINPQLKLKLQRSLKNFLNLNQSQRKVLLVQNNIVKDYCLDVQNSQRQLKEQSKNLQQTSSPQCQFTPQNKHIIEEKDIIESNLLIGQVQSIVASESQLNIVSKGINYFQQKQKSSEPAEFQLLNKNTQRNFQNPFYQSNQLLQMQADTDDVMIISQMDQLSEREQNQKP